MPAVSLPLCPVSLPLHPGLLPCSRACSLPPVSRVAVRARPRRHCARIGVHGFGMRISASAGLCVRIREEAEPGSEAVGVLGWGAWPRHRHIRFCGAMRPNLGGCSRPWRR
ncbi:hypothetical protein FM112_09265 [Gulosibacter sp. 10]|nr:hypothetical protein FM112_09265 [Gulosibacter sp. 10]